jgi:plastocyanin
MWVRRIALIWTASLACLWLGVAPASAGGGCFHAPPTDGTGDAVSITDNCFQATILHVASGTRVTWTNLDPWAHTVTGVGGTWGDLGQLDRGASVSYRFDADGVYLYSCLIHPGMVGAVVVGDGSGDAGLAPAAVVAAGDRPRSGAQRRTAEPTGTTRAVWPALLAGVVGIALGFGMAATRSRRRDTARVGAAAS